jgi:hypothetical protein
MDTKILEFLLSYRNRKQKKQDADVIMIKVKMKNEGKNSYNDFLRQFFKQFLKRVINNWNECLYKNLIRESNRNNMLFKKLLLSLRMLYFTHLKNEESGKNEKFIQKIGNFGNSQRTLIAGRGQIIEEEPENDNFGFVQVVSLDSSEKVEEMKISEGKLDRNNRNIKSPIEFRVMNFQEKLSNCRKRIKFGAKFKSEQFHQERIERKTIRGFIKRT